MRPDKLSERRENILGIMATLDPATSLTTAEQALRDLIAAVMYAEHGTNWMDTAIDPSTRQRWQAVRAQEAEQRAGHTLTNATDISYAYLGDLVDLIQNKGNWVRLFQPVLGDKAKVFALLDLLQRVRRPVDHARPLLPFEEDLVSGIAGYIRNRVSIYLSDQDPDGDWYPRVESIEDDFGNSCTYTPGLELSQLQFVQAPTTLSVGQLIRFHCIGTDPQGRTLRWWLNSTPPLNNIEAVGEDVTLVWTVRPEDTGATHAVIIYMAHTGPQPYHRNVQNNIGADGVVLFSYRVVPPRS